MGFGPINRPAGGVLTFLDVRADGEGPRSVADEYQYTLPAQEFIAADNAIIETGLVGSGIVPGVWVAFLNTVAADLSPPPGEKWWVRSGVAWGTTAVGDNLRFKVCLAQRFGAVLAPMACVSDQAASSLTDAVGIGMAQARLQGGFIVTNRDVFCAGIERNPAVSVNLSLQLNVLKFRG